MDIRFFFFIFAHSPLAVHTILSLFHSFTPLSYAKPKLQISENLIEISHTLPIFLSPSLSISISHFALAEVFCVHLFVCVCTRSDEFLRPKLYINIY